MKDTEKLLMQISNNPPTDIGAQGLLWMFKMWKNTG